MSKLNQFRQGDVFLIETNDIPATATEVKRDDGRVVLAYGEVTGHAHAIVDQSAVLMSFGAERYLRVTEPVTLRHEEHATIELPAANYRVVIQREYQPGELPRQVVD
jgi:hypothetical protein